MTTRLLTQRVASADLTLMLHEEADRSITEVDLPTAGTVLIIIDLEGGISTDEHAELTRAGAQPVSISEWCCAPPLRALSPRRTQAAAGARRCVLTYLPRPPIPAPSVLNLSKDHSGSPRMRRYRDGWPDRRDHDSARHDQDACLRGRGHQGDRQGGASRERGSARRSGRTSATPITSTRSRVQMSSMLPTGWAVS